MVARNLGLSCFILLKITFFFKTNALQQFCDNLVQSSKITLPSTGSAVLIKIVPLRYGQYFLQASTDTGTANGLYLKKV